MSLPSNTTANLVPTLTITSPSGTTTPIALTSSSHNATSSPALSPPRISKPKTPLQLRKPGPLTAQEMTSSLRDTTQAGRPPGTGPGRCKCGRNLPGTFCQACYADLTLWTRRLRQAVETGREGEKGRLGFYWRAGRWCRVGDRGVHLWEAHAEVVEWAAGLDRAAGGQLSLDGEDGEELVRLVREVGDWARLADVGCRSRDGARDNGVRETRGRVGDESGAEVIRGRRYGERPFSRWNDGAEKSSMSLFDERVSDENRARAEPGSSGGTGTDSTRRPAPQKKVPFWRRAQAKITGKKANTLKKLRKWCASNKAILGGMSPWKPFRAYGLD